MPSKALEAVILELFKVKGLKFGSFTLKSGLISPVYFDLRVIVAYPKILRSISELVGEEVKLRSPDLICGVPYTALPVASIVSVEHGVPMILKRKEQKSYGTGKLLEGEFSSGQKCLVIEDVVTSGGSVIETANTLRAHGLLVDEAIVVLDRGQGAKQLLEKDKITMKALITMENMITVLLSHGLITPEDHRKVVTYLDENQIFDPILDDIILSKLQKKLSCPISVKLVNIMRKKSTNLCLSVDLDKWEDVLEAVDLVGGKICLVKTHVDTIGLKGVKVITEFWEKLKALSQKHNFLIMEDRKFADIGSTSKKQLESKPFEISKWADLVTVHGISGPGILAAVEQLGANMGAVLIAEMSSEQNIPTQLPGYKTLIYKMAKDPKYSKVVAGFVSQSPETEILLEGSSSCYLQFTPGVSLDRGASGDGLGQQYNSVEDAILDRGADVIIVGRGILSHGKDQWETIAELFRKRGWNAFGDKLKKIK